MRRLCLFASIIAAAGLATPSSAVAADPAVNHFTVSDSFSDPDFCGTGKTVNGVVAVTVTEFLVPNQPGADYKFTQEGDVYWTNPANGDEVIVHFAGSFTVQFLSDTTQLETPIGLPQQIKTAHGAVLTRDAGYIRIFYTFDNDGNIVDSDIIIDRGPHPEAEADFALFCDVVSTGLGL
jgi:hypothetical protein